MQLGTPRDACAILLSSMACLFYSRGPPTVCPPAPHHGLPCHPALHALAPHCVRSLVPGPAPPWSHVLTGCSSGVGERPVPFWLCGMQCDPGVPICDVWNQTLLGVFCGKEAMMVALPSAGLSPAEIQSDLAAVGGQPRAGVRVEGAMGGWRMPQMVAVLEGMAAAWAPSSGALLQSPEVRGPRPVLLEGGLAGEEQSSAWRPVWGRSLITGCVVGPLPGDWTGRGRCAWEEGREGEGGWFGALTRPHGGHGSASFP